MKHPIHHNYITYIWLAIFVLMGLAIVITYT